MSSSLDKQTTDRNCTINNGVRIHCSLQAMKELILVCHVVNKDATCLSPEELASTKCQTFSKVVYEDNSSALLMVNVLRITPSN